MEQQRDENLKKKKRKRKKRRKHLNFLSWLKVAILAFDWTWQLKIVNSSVKTYKGLRLNKVGFKLEFCFIFSNSSLSTLSFPKIINNLGLKHSDHGASTCIEQYRIVSSQIVQTLIWYCRYIWESANIWNLPLDCIRFRINRTEIPYIWKVTERTKRDKHIAYIRWTRNSRSVHCLGSNIYQDGALRMKLLRIIARRFKWINASRELCDHKREPMKLKGSFSPWFKILILISVLANGF